MNTTLLLLLLLIVGAILLLGWGIYVGWTTHRGPEAERVARRLRGVIGAQARQADVSIVKQRYYSANVELDKLLHRLPGTARLDRMLMQAGTSQHVASLLAICAGTGVVGMLLAAWLRLPALALLAVGGACAAVPVLRLGSVRQARLKRFETQLPDALDMMSRAMRAGHAFPTALKLVADEMSTPLGEEFKAVFDEVNFGVSMGDGLGNLAQRVPSMDLQYFVVAVLIQRESGGNLTELLTSISAIIRERLKLVGQVRTLSAEGRMSAWILCLLPFGAGAMMYYAAPDTMNLMFTDPGGRKLLYIALAMMLLGVLAIRKIVRVRM